MLVAAREMTGSILLHQDLVLKDAFAHICILMKTVVGANRSDCVGEQNNESFLLQHSVKECVRVLVPHMNTWPIIYVDIVHVLGAASSANCIDGSDQMHYATNTVVSI